MLPHYQQVKDFFEQSALRYREHPKAYRQFYFRQRLSIASQLLPPARRLLDVGCGNGDFYDYLASIHQSAGYVGLDISPAMLALSHIPASQQQVCTLETYSQQIPGPQFDAVLALGLTTYYLPGDLAGFYQAIEQVLVPGGSAIISYTHSKSWDFILRRRLHRLLAPLFPKQLSMGRSFPIYAAVWKEVEQELPPGLRLGEVVYLPAAIPFLTNLFPRLSVQMAQGVLKNASSRWRADFVVCLHKK